jgi:hypothetical protein
MDKIEKSEAIIQISKQIAALFFYYIILLEQAVRNCGWRSLLKFRGRGFGTSSSLHLDDNLSSRVHAHKCCRKI